MPPLSSQPTHTHLSPVQAYLLLDLDIWDPPKNKFFSRICLIGLGIGASDSGDTELKPAELHA